jgi:hypothetical protein
MADERRIPADAVKLGLWQSFCDRHEIAGSAVSLFESEDGCVVTRAHKRDHRRILERSKAMEDRVVREVRRVLAPGSRFEGDARPKLYREVYNTEGVNRADANRPGPSFVGPRRRSRC